MTAKRVRTILLIIAAILAILVIGFVAYSRFATAGPEQEALNALVTDDVVEVQTGDWYVFEPADSTPETGLIFYPGGYVDPRAYAPAAREIAAAGYLVVIPTMPLNLAVLGANQAAISCAQGHWMPSPAHLPRVSVTKGSMFLSRCQDRSSSTR